MNWLWDRKVKEGEVKKTLKNPDNPRFVEFAALLLERNNSPKEIFARYLKPVDFVNNWQRIKKVMRKNRWAEPRIIFWQAVYERVRDKLKEKGVLETKKPVYQADPLLAGIGKRVTHIRKNKKLTQEQLAEKMDVSQQFVSRIERGRENLSMTSVKKVAEALGIGMDDLVEG